MYEKMSIKHLYIIYYNLFKQMLKVLIILSDVHKSGTRSEGLKKSHRYFIASDISWLDEVFSKISSKH